MHFFIYCAVLLWSMSLIHACYKFPNGKPDPCLKEKCKFGAYCIRSVDGLKAQCQCPQNCPSFGDTDNNKPVCGTDSKMYRNSCEMRKAGCEKLKRITAQYEGRCNPRMTRVPRSSTQTKNPAWCVGKKCGGGSRATKYDPYFEIGTEYVITAGKDSKSSTTPFPKDSRGKYASSTAKGIFSWRK